VHEGDELADLQTFFLSTCAVSTRDSLGDRLEIFNGEASRDFDESKLRRARLIVSLGDILIDILEVAGAFEEQDDLLGAIVGHWFDWLCLLVGDNDNGFDTFGLLLALTKREPPSAAHLDTLSSMLTKGNLRSDPIKRAQRVVTSSKSAL